MVARRSAVDQLQDPETLALRGCDWNRKEGVHALGVGPQCQAVVVGAADDEFIPALDNVPQCAEWLQRVARFEIKLSLTG